MNRRDLLKLVAAVPAAVARADWTPALFDTHQNQTVIALVDLIIPETDTPGAKAALVNRHMDHILAALPSEDQKRFLQGLEWIDGYATRRHGKPFAPCTPAQQTAILQLLDTSNDAAVAQGARFFHELKGITSEIYYSTEQGFNELNKGGRVPSTFACTHTAHN